MNGRAKQNNNFCSRFYSSFVVFALAYVIAIQATLIGYAGAATAAAGSVDPFAQLCAQRDRDEAPATPVHDANASCCIAAGCSGPAAVPLPQTDVTAPELRVIAAGRDAVHASGFIGWPSERPKSSRAPPV